jgi:hypothetical protein
MHLLDLRRRRRRRAGQKKNCIKKQRNDGRMEKLRS